jgi:hypothetical protein
VKRSAQLRGGPLRIPLVGFGERGGVHRECGVKPALMGGDPREILRHQLARRDTALLQRRADIED